MALRILPHFESKMKHLHREHRTGLTKLALKQVLKPATYIRLNSSGNPYVIMSIHVIYSSGKNWEKKGWKRHHQQRDNHNKQLPGTGPLTSDATPGFEPIAIHSAKLM